MLRFGAAFSLGAPASTVVRLPEVHDAVTATNKVCGVYGDPHIEQPGGVMASHMGSGEYSLISLPSLGAEVHYYGCGVQDPASTARPMGSYLGALAIKIGDKTIEIVGNDLFVVGGDQYEIDYNNDKVMGPFEVSATSTTITIEREVIATEDLYKATYLDQTKEAAGEMLYRWTVTTPSGFQLHSHVCAVAGLVPSTVERIRLLPCPASQLTNLLPTHTCPRLTPCPNRRRPHAPPRAAG